MGLDDFKNSDKNDKDNPYEKDPENKDKWRHEEPEQPEDWERKTEMEENEKDADVLTVKKAMEYISEIKDSWISSEMTLDLRKWR